MVLPQRYTPTVNCYLLESRGHWALIDAGDDLGMSLWALGRALKTIGVPRQGLERILVTHRHWDHVGGAAAIQERWGAEVALPAAEQAPIPFGRDTMIPWLKRHGVGPELLAAQAPVWQRAPRLRWPKRVRGLEPGAEVAVGDLRLQVLAAPGHSGGHIMFAEVTRGWLFTGDTVVPDVGWNVWHHAIETGDLLGRYLQTLGRAAGLQAELVLPGHGTPFTGDRLPGVAQALAVLHRRRLEEGLTALPAGAVSAYELACRLGAVTENDGVVSLVEAIATTLPILYYLEETGVLQGQTSGGVARWAAVDRQQRALGGSGGR